MPPTEIRADDVGASSSPYFKPSADPDQWIEQLAAPYRECPWAVIRELVQNATDASRSAASGRMIEIAILDSQPELPEGRYHLVVRDNGDGMDDESFCRNVGILGVGGRKRGDLSAIGEFGVGFYSTHAICLDVAVISRRDGGSTIGWRYEPASKTFFRLTETEKAGLLSRDFEKHGRPGRQRGHGTSVFLRLDLHRYGICRSWLQPETLYREAKRDFYLLPVALYVADYRTNPSGGDIFDFNQQEVSGRSVTLDQAPWELAEAQEPAVRELLQRMLPYTPKEELPKEWGVFSKRVEGGSVEGLLYLNNRLSKGNLDMFLKRMWVESSADAKPLCAEAVHGAVSIRPAEDFKVRVPAARDHLIRDQDFDRARVVIEDACIDFLAARGLAVVRRLQAELQQSPGMTVPFDRLRAVLADSVFMSSHAPDHLNFDALLSDVPRLIADVLGQPDVHSVIMDAAAHFVRRVTENGASQELLRGDGLRSALGRMQQTADQHANEETRAVNRRERAWSPRATAKYFKEVGPYLPVHAAFREVRRDGGFNTHFMTVPLAAVTAIDPTSARGIEVLVNGHVDEFLASDTGVNAVIIPPPPGGARGDVHQLMVALVNHLNPDRVPKPRFREHRRDFFEEIANAEQWVPLVERFNLVVNGLHNRPSEPAGRNVIVEAKAYKGSDAIPLVFVGTENPGRLVVNAFSGLMQSIMGIYDAAAKRNDEECTQLITGICHELYHHAMPVEVHEKSIDMHVYETRNQMLRDVVSMIRKYMEQKHRKP